MSLYHKGHFGKDDVEFLETRIGFKGFFRVLIQRLRHRKFAGGWTGIIEREVFARGAAAAAVLYDPKQDLVGLVEQFRPGVLADGADPWCLEVVAGMLEAGETPDELIRREIFEEAGIEHCELIPITTFYPSPGGCDEKAYLYCALCNLGESGQLFGLDTENEDILLHVLPADEVFSVMLNSRMNNAATLIGLQWLQCNRDKLK